MLYGFILWLVEVNGKLEKRRHNKIFFKYLAIKYLGCEIYRNHFK